jgi:hypothetical protein
MDDKIITFESYNDPMLAEIIRGRLVANGIECFIADNLTIGANPLFTNAIGGVKLKIFERDLDKCREILAQSEELEIQDVPPEEEETICPYCNSTNVRYGSATVKRTNWVGLAIAFLFMTYPFYARQAWHCFNCGKDFE